MAEESRARQLGDVGSNAPAGWAWGRAGSEPHAVVMFFAETARFDAFRQECTGSLWDEAFGTPHWLETEYHGTTEPFGFTDSISQPQIDWSQARDPADAATAYGNVAALGEFCSATPTSTARSPTDPCWRQMPRPPNCFPPRTSRRRKTWPETAPISSCATWIRTCASSGNSSTNRRAKILQRPTNWARNWSGARGRASRWRRARSEVIPGVDAKTEGQNHFTFDGDPTGGKCPFGAHIRRVNPRNTDFPEPPAGPVAKLVTMLGFGPDGFRDDLMSAVRFHRIVRRGREYGEKLLPQDALVPAPANEAARGLHFVCLNANISRQFEFLQNAWIMNTKFSGLTGESDPLLGNREAIPGCPVTSGFSIPQGDGTRRRVAGLPQFVTVRGGAYFFLPSLRALRYFASAGDLIAWPL